MSDFPTKQDNIKSAKKDGWIKVTAEDQYSSDVEVAISQNGFQSVGISLYWFEVEELLKKLQKILEEKP